MGLLFNSRLLSIIISLSWCRILSNSYRNVNLPRNCFFIVMMRLELGLMGRLGTDVLRLFELKIFFLFSFTSFTNFVCLFVLYLPPLFFWGKGGPKKKKKKKKKS